MRTAILSLFMLTGILMWGAGVYTVSASNDHIATDGYGVGSQALN